MDSRQKSPRVILRSLVITLSDATSVASTKHRNLKGTFDLQHRERIMSMVEFVHYKFRKENAYMYTRNQ
jgi:hypothetical protein